MMAVFNFTTGGLYFCWILPRQICIRCRVWCLFSKTNCIWYNPILLLAVSFMYSCRVHSPNPFILHLHLTSFLPLMFRAAPQGHTAIVWLSSDKWVAGRCWRLLSAGRVQPCLCLYVLTHQWPTVQLQIQIYCSQSSCSHLVFTLVSINRPVKLSSDNLSSTFHKFLRYPSKSHGTRSIGVQGDSVWLMALLVCSQASSGTPVVCIANIHRKHLKKLYTHGGPTLV